MRDFKDGCTSGNNDNNNKYVFFLFVLYIYVDVDENRAVIPSFFCAWIQKPFPTSAEGAEEIIIRSLLDFPGVLQGIVHP